MDRHFIFRTSWVFGARGANFLKTILRLAREREEISVIDDQIGAPTSAELIADVTAYVLMGALRGNLSGGLYHLSAAGETSWNGYARFIVAESIRLGETFRLTPERVRAIPTEDYPLPAPRPRNSRLDSRRLESAMGLVMPDWHVHVTRTLREILAK
jgi:dTDP-4-dehydrorhamnose reductase